MKYDSRMNLARALIVVASVFGAATGSMDVAQASVIDPGDPNAKAIIGRIAAYLGTQTEQIAESLNKKIEYTALFEQTQDPAYQALADIELLRVQAAISQYKEVVDIGENLLNTLPSTVLGSARFYTDPDIYLRLSALTNPSNTTRLRFATSDTDGYALDLAVESDGVSTPLIDLYIPAEGGSVPVAPTPLPPGILLFGSALLAMAAAGYGFRRKRRATAV